jgi:hypothetical protein
VHTWAADVAQWQRDCLAYVRSWSHFQHHKIIRIAWWWWCVCVCVCVCVCARMQVAGMDSRALVMLGNCSTAEPHKSNMINFYLRVSCLRALCGGHSRALARSSFTEGLVQLWGLWPAHSCQPSFPSLPK